MIVDLNKVERDPFAALRYDVCIVGGGVAGITLALNLSPSLRILLLEGGGYENTVETQDVYAGSSVGQEYFDLRVSRLRFLGGSSNHWAGDCRPLDDFDFESSPNVPHSGWPIRKTDIDPYLESAGDILELNGEDWNQPGGYFEDRINRSKDFRSIRYRFSPPIRFGEKYRRDIERRENIDCYLNANVTDLRLDEGGRRMQSVEIRDFNGNVYNASANRFVVATGGIENARLLLNANSQVRGGIGNENGHVGQFFCDHLFTKVADILLEDSATEHVYEYPFGDDFKGRLKNTICSTSWLQSAVESVRGTNLSCLSNVRHFFAPTRELMTRDQILNFSLRLRVALPGHGEAMDGKVFLGAEQAINPRSRVLLDSERDQLGMRRVKLDWQLSDIDLRTVRYAATRFGETLAAQSIGRQKVVDWITSDPLEYLGTGGHHHMCTTRMGDSPKNAVVDPNARVFGVENLFMAGSSIFATGGHANPTLTIVQLTLRLAQHLNTS
jgi:choline dehydrogenase-like flavoprotein